MKKSFRWLSSFLKIGAIGFGGGTSLIPVIEHEMVQSRRLVTKEDYDSAVIAASITPGALPVEISAYVGKDIGGIRGMILAAVCMAFPGVFLTVVLLAALDIIDEEFFMQLELISIGISAFIFSMMTKYISGTFSWAREKSRFNITLAIALGVFMLSAGKPVSKICTYFGFGYEPVFGISTVQILIIAFFVICYAGSRTTRLRIAVSTLVSALYICCQSKAQLMLAAVSNAEVCDIICRSLQIIMAILSIYGIVSAGDKTERPEKISPAGMIKESAVWFIILIIACIPAYFMVPELAKYIGNGFISSLISFGGGDAYLTVADGMFVETGMVSEEDFYGVIVILVNVLPGSILCKMLTGIGYYIGYVQGGGIMAAIATAFSGFVCSIIGSCFTMTVIRYFFDTFEKMHAFNVLKKWIKAIISGLLGTVILSLVYQCIIIADTYGSGNITVAVVVCELAFIYGLNIFLEKKFARGTWMNVIISIAAALILGNIIM